MYQKYNIYSKYSVTAGFLLLRKHIFVGTSRKQERRGECKSIEKKKYLALSK